LELFVLRLNKSMSANSRTTTKTTRAIAKGVIDDTSLPAGVPLVVKEKVYGISKWFPAISSAVAAIQTV
jgi:hypothetical protein